MKMMMMMRSVMIMMTRNLMMMRRRTRMKIFDDGHGDYNGESVEKLRTNMK